MSRYVYDCAESLYLRCSVRMHKLYSKEKQTIFLAFLSTNDRLAIFRAKCKTQTRLLTYKRHFTMIKVSTFKSILNWFFLWVFFFFLLQFVRCHEVKSESSLHYSLDWIKSLFSLRFALFLDSSLYYLRNLKLFVPSAFYFFIFENFWPCEILSISLLLSLSRSVCKLLPQYISSFAFFFLLLPFSFSHSIPLYLSYSRLTLLKYTSLYMLFFFYFSNSLSLSLLSLLSLSLISSGHLQAV